jgi:hypothetical protein
MTGYSVPCLDFSVQALSYGFIIKMQSIVRKHPCQENTWYHRWMKTHLQSKLHSTQSMDFSPFFLGAHHSPDVKYFAQMGITL